MEYGIAPDPQLPFDDEDAFEAVNLLGQASSTHEIDGEDTIGL